MSAHEHLGPMFHGTPYTLNEGDIVEPRKDNTHAYATTSLEYAQNHADKREAAERSRATRDLRGPATEERENIYKSLEAKVYQVEPVGGVETTGNGEDKGNVMSTSGFKVVKRVR